MPLSLGAPLLLALFAASAFPWLLVLRARLGHLLAVPATAATAVLLLLGVLIVSHGIGTNYIVALVVASVVVGGLGVFALLRSPGARRRPGRYAIALWCPALLGAVVWLVTVGLAQVIPGASRFGWTMNGDALNNLVYARMIASQHGIALGPHSNPVPLPAAIIAVALGAGSPANGTASAVLTHELSAFTLAWTILLAITCTAMGVVIASIVKPHLTRTVALVSALGSLLPLTWFVAGLTIQWGYFNVSTILPIAFASWLVFLGSRTRPIAAFAILTVLATLALAAWTPIVILIIPLAVAILLRNLGRFRALRGWRLALVIAGFVQAAAFIAGQTLPTLFALDSSLASPGIGFPNLWWDGVIVVVLVVATVVAVRRRTDYPVVAGIVGLLCGSVVAAVAMLYLSGSRSDPWDSYYPKKLIWTLLVILATIALSFGVAALAGRVRLRLLGSVLVLALVSAIVLPPGNWPEMIQRQPVARILGDYVRHRGETTVDDILNLATTNHSHILWLSGDPDEPIVNEWILLDDSGLVTGNVKLRQQVAVPYFLYRASGRYRDSDIQTLCTTLRYMSAHSTVYTADPTVSAQLAATCPRFHPRVVVTRAFEGPPPPSVSETWETDGIE